MASQAAAKAAGGLVSISKVRKSLLVLGALLSQMAQITLGFRSRTSYHDGWTTMADSNLQKHTLQSTGIWETIRKAFAIDPNRSNGVPLNPYFRNPTPGGLDPQTYDDPVTIPAGDIADNAYWKRDVRRSYPQLSVVNQSYAASLLTIGSAAKPKVELIGEAGEQALVAAQKEGETGLAAFFEKAPKDVANDVFVDGLPPLPSGQTLVSGAWDVHKYELNEEQEQTYGAG
jgi:hypothetical protein